jgi:hypothetical protein
VDFANHRSVGISAMHGTNRFGFFDLYRLLLLYPQVFKSADEYLIPPTSISADCCLTGTPPQCPINKGYSASEKDVIVGRTPMSYAADSIVGYTGNRHQLEV